MPSLDHFAFCTITQTVCVADNKVCYNNRRKLVWSINIPTNKEEDSNKDDKEKGNNAAYNQKRFKQSDDKTENKNKVPTVNLQDFLDVWALSAMVDGMCWSHLRNAAHPPDLERQQPFPGDTQ